MKKLLSDILGRIRATSTAKIKYLTKDIHEREKFHELIELERNRVHRDERQFSLVLISVNRSKNENADLIKLVQKASKRVRRIDQIGWFDNNHLGVLLPNTTLGGAQIIAQEICNSQNGSKSTIPFETLSYPDNKNEFCEKEEGTQVRRGF